MPINEITYKPKYNGSRRFALYLWPVWAVLFFYFLYAAAVTQSYNPQGLLAFIFSAMTFTLLFRVFRQATFADQTVVKRYFIRDLRIDYKDITAFDPYGSKAKTGNISMQMMHPESARQFAKIINQLMTHKKIKLKKLK